MNQIVICLIFVSLFLSCEDGEEKNKKRIQNQNNFMFLLSYSRETGNCKIEITDETTKLKTTTCNRKPNGVCNINTSLITQSEITLQLSEGKKITDKYSECELSFLQSGILLLKPTTSEEESKMKSNTIYASIESCESDGFNLNSESRLATFHELRFLESARGKIGKTAKNITINRFLSLTIRERATACLEKEYSLAERNFYDDLVLSRIVESVRK
ncbi:MAG: hypothetical protein SH817_09560 [Leptospira sp.]|nr:hypothetical protein [Leptospira sp.]